MSTYKKVNFPCLSCHANLERSILKAMHITRLPEIRASILDASFQKFTCEHCHSINQLEAPTIYTDFTNHHYIAVELPQIANISTLCLKHKKVFDQNFILGPNVAQKLGSSLKTRVVFGLRGLREKLLIWDHAYDDRLIEIGKKIILEESGFFSHEFELRILNVIRPQNYILFGLYPVPQDVLERDVEPKTVVSQPPIDTVLVSKKTLDNWHAQAPMLLQHHSWARSNWFVDARMSDI